MKREARTAFNKLRAIGAPVIEAEGYGEFKICAEHYGRDDGYYEGHKDESPNGFPWADYYIGSNEHEFGVNKIINDTLREHGLYCEWHNAGELGVYS